MPIVNWSNKKIQSMCLRSLKLLFPKLQKLLHTYQKLVNTIQSVDADTVAFSGIDQSDTVYVFLTFHELEQTFSMFYLGYCQPTT
jgi:hypothetical protein